MTQATLTPTTTREASSKPTFTFEIPENPPAETGAFAAFFDRARKDPWIVPKLLFLALVSTPQVFAIATVATSESPGILIAVIPDMVATIIVACGMIGCLLFLDDSEGENA